MVSEPSSLNKWCISDPEVESKSNNMPPNEISRDFIRGMVQDMLVEAHLQETRKGKRKITKWDDEFDNEE